MQTLLKSYLVVSLAGFTTLSFAGPSYINWTGGGAGETTDLYDADNWTGTPGTNYTVDAEGNGQQIESRGAGAANQYDTLSLRVRGTQGVTSASAPATSNATNWEADSFNVGDFGTAYAKIDTGHTMTVYNANVGQVTNASPTNADGTLYVDGTLAVTNVLNIGANSANNASLSAVTNGYTATGHLVIGDGGNVDGYKTVNIGNRNSTISPGVTGTLTIQTGGSLNNDSDTQTDISATNLGTQGFVIGKWGGANATLNMNGGTANIYSLILGDQTEDYTGQTVNINMNDGEVRIMGWVNGDLDDSTVTRNLTMDEGVFYLTDTKSTTTGNYNNKRNEVLELLGFFGDDADAANDTYLGTLTATVINGGLSDATLIADFTNNYTSQTGQAEVNGGTIYWGRYADKYTDANGISYGEMAVWAVPEASSYSLIAGILAMTSIMLRRRL